MSTIEPQEPWASAMIAVGAVDPRREGAASWNRLGEIADVHTSTITGFIAVDERRIPRTPCTRINLPALGAEVVVPLSVEQVQSIVNRLWAPYKALGALVAATGLRGGEARGLTWDRITPKGHGAILTIDRQLATTEPTWGPLKTAVLADRRAARGVCASHGRSTRGRPAS